MARAVLGHLREAERSLAEQADPLDVADLLAVQIAGLDRLGSAPDRFWHGLSEYLDAEHGAEGVSLVPGMINRLTRVIVIATEKAGKSLLTRQFAMCVSAGIHPFTFDDIAPVRTLIVDAENDDAELRPTIGRMLEVVRRRVPHAMGPALMSSPYGMDLARRRDRGELEAVLEDCRPELVIAGPIYKMLRQDDRTSDPRHAERLQEILDDIRRRWKCALVLEHHAPMGKSGAERELRSVGGQRWAAWPEVTIALHRNTRQGPDRLDVRYPHPPRGSFRWPRAFERAGHAHEFPWLPLLQIEDPPKQAPPEPPEEEDWRDTTF